MLNNILKPNLKALYMRLTKQIFFSIVALLHLIKASIRLFLLIGIPFHYIYTTYQSLDQPFDSYAILIKSYPHSSSINTFISYKIFKFHQIPIKYCRIQTLNQTFFLNHTLLFSFCN
jgi:hypothetical protein